MKAVLFPGDRQVAVVERPTPKPGPGQALVRVRASAICRSDMSLYYGKPIVGGEATATGQIVPGHEPAGEVVAVGDGVTGRCSRRPGRDLSGRRLRQLRVLPRWLSLPLPNLAMRWLRRRWRQCRLHRRARGELPPAARRDQLSRLVR